LSQSRHYKSEGLIQAALISTQLNGSLAVMVHRGERVKPASRRPATVGGHGWLFDIHARLSFDLFLSLLFLFIIFIVFYFSTIFHDVKARDSPSPWSQGIV